jgi:hypothetical protein
MAISDYNPNIPLASAQLSVSQGQLLLNFGALQQWLAVNHVDYATSGAGKHKWVSLPVQSPNSPPTGAFAANEVGLYSFQNPQTTKNELYINKEDGTQVPITACNPASTGYTYLPGGILVKWFAGSGSHDPFNIAGNPIDFNATPFGSWISYTGPAASNIVASARPISATEVVIVSAGSTNWQLFVMGTY